MRFNLIYVFYLILFILSLLALGFEAKNLTKSVTKNLPSANTDSRFFNAYISTFKPNKNSLNIYSDEIVDQGIKNKIYLVRPKGDLGPKRETFFEGLSGVVDRNNSILQVSNNVLIKQASAITSADQLFFNYKDNSATASGNIASLVNDSKREVKISSRELNISDAGAKLTYLGLVNGQIKDLNSKSYRNIEFKSDLLTYNDFKKIIFLEGNAYIKRGKSEISAINGNIWLNNNGSGVKYFVMNDDVKLKDEYISSRGKRVFRNSISEKIEGFATEEKLVLSGFPQVEQEGDIIKGNEIIIREDQEMIEIINTNSQFKLINRK